MEPEPEWVAAWTGGKRTVHLGNIGEFNAQFPGSPPEVARGTEHYACLMAFAAPEPSVVVLPFEPDEAWRATVARELGWPGDVEIYGGVTGDRGLCDALLARPALLERVRSDRERLIPWGITPGVERVRGTGPDAVRSAVLRYESKAHAHALFATLAAAHPGVVVPRQWAPRSRGAAARLLATRARAGRTTVAKSEYGVAGSSTVLVTPGRLRDAGGAGPAASWLTRGGLLTGGAPAARPAARLLLEEYIDGDDGPFRHPTFDAVVADDGAVHLVGTGAMRLDGTRYQGVTVGPGSLPRALAATVERFGLAVGRGLAADGYRGWFDVDFVTDREGRPAPTEINTRVSGGTPAYVVAARLDRLRGGRHVVRTLDAVPLEARLPARALMEHLDAVADSLRPLGVTLLPTLPTASFDPWPYVGVAIAAREAAAVDAAEQALRSANAGLGAMFADLAVTSPPAPAGR